MAQPTSGAALVLRRVASVDMAAGHALRTGGPGIDAAKRANAAARDQRSLADLGVLPGDAGALIADRFVEDPQRQRPPAMCSCRCRVTVRTHCEVTQQNGQTGSKKNSTSMSVISVPTNGGGQAIARAWANRILRSIVAGCGQRSPRWASRM